MTADTTLTIPSWNHVVSSSSLSAVPAGRFAGAKVLVIDDMVRKGRALGRILRQLRDMGATDDALSNVRVAAFAMHEDAGGGYLFNQTHYPDAVWLQHLPTEGFRQTRARLVAALQRAGSLMLDTEHVEIRLRLRVPLVRLAEALSRSGEVVVFKSGSDRHNITVFYDGTRPTSELMALPPGTRTDGVVRKCRVVERLPGECALIPICLPDTPRSWDPAWQPAAEDRSMLAALSELDDEARFHAVALRASLEPLFIALRDISAVREELCEVHLPDVDNNFAIGGAGYDLNHLSVAYPALDLAMFHDRLAQLWKRADAAGRRLRARRWPAGRIVSPPRERLETDALSLLKRIERLADERAAEQFEGSGAGQSLHQGITMPEVMALGQSGRLPKAIVSACMDVLIDEAMLVTKVERMHVADAGDLVCRTYLPDGEVASDLVRDHTRRYGLEPPSGYWS